MILAGGVPHMFGVNTDPALVEAISGETVESLKLSDIDHFKLYNYYFQSGGVSDLGVAILIIFVAVFAYRKGEKWSWFALCTVPAFFTAFMILNMSLPDLARNSMFPFLMVFIIISTIGLLLPIRKFFPKKS
jgi:MFS-type transporter involved in bile tolerance (Atg22 family)